MIAEVNVLTLSLPLATLAAAPVGIGFGGKYKLSVRFGSRGDGIISWPSVRWRSSTSSNG